LLFLAAPAFAQFGGPAILSRGDAPAAMSVPQIDFIPFLSLVGVYDTGLATVSVNSQRRTGECGFRRRGAGLWHQRRS
jgi:hypothetical protein